ncbi:DEHA2F26356p [Debaryomyces hansenii CBS767]|uniref:N-acetyltransferase ECO1 n=1 Tax=Debaryomyces hansenii (strain ATCC 36239 / CBS 767 / BCRC 21394 / JCM 1990 / NBRC 0083 / IGC 2968) TaxID=284592 RepID=ECO1_DEBHA|nr:DEHA2F26356p [Debaryomyces hansenii CBS767]Q6BJY5.2 RecName: Full=N-acetyltransferase ECO1; AltName: Full=Establishment of cohesion protein 1 [Debaryomyces hansenii CBS767]CAR66419.1 DEHA2F26356p [Debaryomyces hansenii CBS767]|eukprot:XP_002770903.1 DEHA2F26356p [Debaryomyces hansenii CBS767]
MKRDITQLLSPELSQSSSRNDKKRKPTNSNKKVQTVLNFPSSSPNASQSTTCPTCGMTYYSHVSKDNDVHNKYHFNFINGIPWPTSFCNNVLERFIVVDHTTGKAKGTSKSKKSQAASKETLVMTIDRRASKQVKRVEEILKVVNGELNAASDGKAWQKDHKGPIQGRAFIVVIDGRAIGICTTEPIQDVDQQCRWIIHRTQALVPNQVNRSIKLGISRIWIAPKWRRYGLARRLLDIVLVHSVYGIVLDKKEIGFSQPSFSGGLLAKSFNGVTHKSGEILIPVYLEE